MSPLSHRAPHPDEWPDLYRRLAAGDPVAPPALARAYIVHLSDYLAAKYPAADPHLREQAVDDALIALIKNPQSYKPERGLSLTGFLRMSARGDLRNLLRGERRHWEKRHDLESVELHLVDGNTSGRDGDEVSPLGGHPALAGVRAGLTEPERRVLDLMCRDERRTAAYAAVLGLSDLPAGEQAKAVKRVKDRIKKRLRRAGGEP